MSFTIEVEFVRGLYEAGTEGQEEDTEWPPSPARLFCALVAVAESDAHDHALRWLEAQEPPSIRAGAAVQRGKSREGYVPLNKLVGGSSYGRFAARKAGSLQQWFHVSPAEPSVQYHWAADAPSDIEQALSELADAVPYLGRSTSPIIMRVGPTSLAAVVNEQVGENEGDLSNRIQPLVPGGLGSPTVVSVPTTGYLDSLRAAFAEDVSAHEVPRRRLRYGTEAPEPKPVHKSVFDPEFIVLPFVDARRVSAAYAMVISRAIRKALESHLDGGPLVLRGARAGEPRPEHQVLIVLLPQVGHRHASGLAAGVGIVLPREIDSQDRRSIYDAIVQVEANGVVAGRLGRLLFDQQMSSLKSLDTSSWTRPSRIWTTATPMTLDRFIRSDRPDLTDAEVRRACRFAGVPEPVMVQVSRRPLLEGAPVIRANLRVRREGETALPSVHVRVVFDRLVEGPLVLGNLRRYGLGLFIPAAADD